jgi:proprotein convertase subtilisin/kexin type 2
VPGATSYNVYYSTNETKAVPVEKTNPNTTKAANVVVSGTTSLSTTFTALKGGRKYYFVVTAVIGGKESAVSNRIAARTGVEPPSGLSVSAIAGEAALKWKSSKGATGYNIYYSPTPGVNPINSSKISGKNSGAVVTGLTKGTKYYFAVSAVGPDDESALSAEVSTTHVASVPNGDGFTAQWHLLNTGQNGGTPGEDLNIVNAWEAYLGTGTRVAVVDNGLDVGHENLSANVAAGASWDYTTSTNASPTVGDHHHGTAVAGLVAAVGSNSIGVTGTAMEAQIVGYNLLQFPTTANEADAMTRGIDSNDIYVNGFGAQRGSGALNLSSSVWEAAITQGITKGRNGNGAIYLKAAGNGYPIDNSNYDMSANSFGVITIAAMNNKGTKASYSEEGANILVSAYGGESCRNNPQDAITTTDVAASLQFLAGGPTHGNGDYVNNNYTLCMNGTASAAAQAAGVTSLILQANPNLTWRDVRLILAKSARKNHSSGILWNNNGSGLHFNIQYGYGAIDAASAVDMAKNWINVGPLMSATGASGEVNLPIPDGTGIAGKYPASGEAVTNIASVANSGISKMEYAEVTIYSDHQNSGDLEIILTSPAGTESLLSASHDCVDPSTNTVTACGAWPAGGFRFGVAGLIDEPADGSWTLNVRDGYQGNSGNLKSWTITAYGH